MSVVSVCFPYPTSTQDLMYYSGGLQLLWDLPKVSYSFCRFVPRFPHFGLGDRDHFFSVAFVTVAPFKLYTALSICDWRYRRVRRGCSCPWKGHVWMWKCRRSTGVWNWLLLSRIPLKWMGCCSILCLFLGTTHSRAICRECAVLPVSFGLRGSRSSLRGAACSTHTEALKKPEPILRDGSFFLPALRNKSAPRPTHPPTYSLPRAKTRLWVFLAPKFKYVALRSDKCIYLPLRSVLISSGNPPFESRLIPRPGPAPHQHYDRVSKRITQAQIVNTPLL